MRRHTGAFLLNEQTPGAMAEDTLPEAAPLSTEDSPTQLKLLEDFPEPLTELQRRSFQKHVAYHVRRHTMMQRSTRTIRSGFQSLHGLVDRLRAERDRLQGELDGASTRKAQEGPVAKRTRTEGSVAAPAVAERPSAEEEAPARPRRTGGLLRSAAFANMQRVLQTGRQEDQERFAMVTQERERIGKQTRLNLITEDLAAQELLMTPLEAKIEKVYSIEAEITAELVPLLALMNEMFLMESIYAASFSLKAVGIEEEERRASGDTYCSAADKTPQVSHDYEIPFTPAAYTPETEDIVRSQVEEVLDSYLTYRARVDPIIKVLDEAREVRQRQRVEQLMGVIGLSGGGKDVLLSRTPQVDGSVMTKTPSHIVLQGTAGKVNGSEVAMKPGLGISDSDDSEEEDQLPVPADGEESACQDRQARQMIQSALTALDDFEEMF